MSITLNKKQELAVKEAKKWWNDPSRRNNEVFSIMGYAGCGKSTAVKSIIEALDIDEGNIGYIAFTGMAASVLTKKGNTASTIHKLIYNPWQDDKGKIHFNLKEVEELEDLDLLVLDEISQVSQNLLDDLYSFKKPMISLGDPQQFPPVSGKPNDLVTKKPNIFLDEVMRQALDNPIVWAATQWREGIQVPYGTHGDNLIIIPKDQVSNEMMTEVDQIITFKNSSVDYINNYVRKEIYNLDSPLPYLGEKLLCIKNDWTKTISENGIEQDLVNGLMGYVTKIGNYNKTYDFFDISLQPTYFKDKEYKKLKADGRYFLDGLKSDDVFYNDPKYKKLLTLRNSLYNSTKTNINKFAYGYGLTTYKSQGTEYPSVLYIDEPLRKDMYWKSAYVGATRAQETLIFAR